MTRNQEQVKEFMLKAKQECPKYPRMPDKNVSELRIRLIDEELKELVLAIKNNNLTGVYDAILDLNYVVTGTACAFGLDMSPGQEEVHRSNMSKFIDGYMRDDGKWIKGPSYAPANLAPIITALHFK